MLEDFYGMITYFGNLNESGASVKDILDQVMEMSGYVEDLKKNNVAEAQTRIENLQELRSLAVEFEKEGIDSLEDFLARIALVQDTDELDHTDSVVMMTYHGAKGLGIPGCIYDRDGGRGISLLSHRDPGGYGRRAKVVLCGDYPGSRKALSHQCRFATAVWLRKKQSSFTFHSGDTGGVD